MRLIDAVELAEELSKRVWYEREDEKQAVRIVKEFPTVDAEPVCHGKFVGKVLHTVWAIRRCSECHEYVPQGKYCSDCGAKMDKECF